MTQRWKQRPPGSNWGDFGPDDPRGRMNWVTREKVLQGIAEVKEGITFCCSLPLDYLGGQVLSPRRAPPRIAATQRDGKQFFCRPLVEFNENMTDVICDDQVLMALQYSTQWDSFAHVGGRFDADGDGKPELLFYNGFRAGEDVVPASDKKSEGWDRFEGSHAKGLSGQGARHPESRRARRAGPRRPGGPASSFSKTEEGDRLRRLDARPGERQGRGGEGRYGLHLHRLRRCSPGNEQGARSKAGERNLHRPQRPRREAPAVDQRFGPGRSPRRQLRR